MRDPDEIECFVKFYESHVKMSASGQVEMSAFGDVVSLGSRTDGPGAGQDETRYAWRRSSSLFERKTASRLLASQQGHWSRSHPPRMASAKWLRSSSDSRRSRKREPRRTTIETPARRPPDGA